MLLESAFEGRAVGTAPGQKPETAPNRITATLDRNLALTSKPRIVLIISADASLA